MANSFEIIAQLARLLTWADPNRLRVCNRLAPSFMSTRRGFWPPFPPKAPICRGDNMNPALLILIYAFVFVVFLIVVTDSDQGDFGDPREGRSNDSASTRRHATTEDSAEIESLDLWGGDAGSRIGDHIITSQSDLPDFDSVSDSWDDSWSHDDW
jgi:hypothetical protein